MEKLSKEEYKTVIKDLQENMFDIIKDGIKEYVTTENEFYCYMRGYHDVMKYLFGHLDNERALEAFDDLFENVIIKGNLDWDCRV